jgi:hypothetical protein
VPAKNRAQKRALFAKLGPKRAKELGYDRIEGQAPKTAAQRKHKKR